MKDIEIEITKRPDDYKANIKGHPEIWGCGRSIDEAIGDLIRSHTTGCGVKLHYMNDLGSKTSK
jgi:hypothetical protein